MAWLKSGHGVPPARTSTAPSASGLSVVRSGWQITPGQCRATTRRRNGDASQNQRTGPRPARRRPRSRPPTPEQREPTVSTDPSSVLDFLSVRDIPHRVARPFGQLPASDRRRLMALGQPQAQLAGSGCTCATSAGWAGRTASASTASECRAPGTCRPIQPPASGTPEMLSSFRSACCFWRGLHSLPALPGSVWARGHRSTVGRACWCCARLLRNCLGRDLPCHR